jgi:hypothetical protein
VPPLDHSQLTVEEAERVFAAFTAQGPALVAALRREVGEDVLDFSPESLRPLWEWFLAREGSRSDPGGELPSWYLPDPPQPAAERLSPATLRDVDAIGRYVAEVFLRNVEGAQWTIGKLPPRMLYVHQNRPVVDVLGRDVDPVGIVYVNAMRALLDGERDPEALMRTYLANVG